MDSFGEGLPKYDRGRYASVGSFTYDGGPQETGEFYPDLEIAYCQ